MDILLTFLAFGSFFVCLVVISLVILAIGVFSMLKVLGE